MLRIFYASMAVFLVSLSPQAGVKYYVTTEIQGGDAIVWPEPWKCEVCRDESKAYNKFMDLGLNNAERSFKVWKTEDERKKDERELIGECNEGVFDWLEGDDG